MTSSIKYTNQSAFDTGLAGIRGQGYKPSASDPPGKCMYRGENGLKCVVGHCVPDELAMIMDEREGSTIVVLINSGPLGVRELFESVSVAMLSDMQYVHDGLALLGRKVSDTSYIIARNHFERGMKSIAQNYGLTYTAPTVST
jgi:hypothetical protein